MFILIFEPHTPSSTSFLLLVLIVRHVTKSSNNRYHGASLGQHTGPHHCLLHFGVATFEGDQAISQCSNS